MLTGTIKETVNMKVLQNEWQQKKNNINEKKQTKELSSEERMRAHFQEQINQNHESNSHAELYTKLQTGGKLTADEIAYLEQKDPEALQKYRADQAEKAAYERELKNCRTKDDVERIKMNKLGNFAAQAKKITTDPYIPLDKKLELMNQLNNKLCLIDEAHKKFLDSRQYQEMPTDGEAHEERTKEALSNLDKMQATPQPEKQNEEDDILGERKTEVSAIMKEGIDKEVERETIEKIKKDIKTFILASGKGHGKIDLSL